jgi:arylsulfatase A-like enzyme
MHYYHDGRRKITMSQLKLLFILSVPVFLITHTLQAGMDKPCGKPHMVIFLADDLGWKDVGYHGSKIKTPHIDSIAKDGVRLEQFYVQPLCSPTRSSLMTGRYPIRYGLQVGVVWPLAQFGLPLAERTLPQGLKQAGYRTVILGKWHLGVHQTEYLPLQRGFDHHYGHYLGAIDYFGHSRMGGLDWHRNGKPVREEGYTTDLLADEAVKIIEEHNPAQPLFLYVPFNAVHTPLQAPQKYIDGYQYIKNVKRRKYAAMTTCMDDAIGRTLEALKKRGIADNTLVLFSSDNGGPGQGANNHPLRGRKGSLYEGGVRVPAAARWPGKLKAGSMVNEPLHIVDWYPMLLKLAGASLEQPLPLDGIDAWPTIAHGKPSPHQEILHDVHPGLNPGAIRQGDWKLIVKGTHSHEPKEKKAGTRIIELFNIAQDPSEKLNLAEKYPEKVKELTARLEYYEKRAIPPLGTSRPTRSKKVKAPKIWGYFE